MSFVSPVAAVWRDRLPGITHVDGTARLQTVARGRAERLHDILSEFANGGAPPVLLNTSFNRKGEPIVQDLDEAAGVYLGSGLDALVTEDSVWAKDPRRLSDALRSGPPDAGG
jgi:carbamoyltransferase